MNKFLMIAVLMFTGLGAGCVMPISNGPFYKKAVSDDAIEAKGNVEYKRKVTVTPRQVLLAPIFKTSSTDEVVGVQSIPVEIIQAGVEVIGAVVPEAMKTSSDTYVKMREAAKIEVEETYKRTNP